MLGKCSTWLFYLHREGARTKVKDVLKNQIRISQVEVVPFRPKSGHLGFASCVINDQFYLGDIAIFSRPTGGIRLGFPVKKLANGETIDIFKPLNQEAEKTVESAVMERYEALMKRDGLEKELDHGRRLV
jgi:DNA-binding cell septation regulator SpoVG